MKIHKYPEHSSCKGKKSYNTLNHANDIGKIQIYENNSEQLYIYQCNYCNKYHLTQQKTEYQVY